MITTTAEHHARSATTDAGTPAFTYSPDQVGPSAATVEVRRQKLSDDATLIVAKSTENGITTYTAKTEYANFFRQTISISYTPGNQFDFYSRGHAEGFHIDYKNDYYWEYCGSKNCSGGGYNYDQVKNRTPESALKVLYKEKDGPLTEQLNSFMNIVNTDLSKDASEGTKAQQHTTLATYEGDIDESRLGGRAINAENEITLDPVLYAFELLANRDWSTTNPNAFVTRDEAPVYISDAQTRLLGQKPKSQDQKLDKQEQIAVLRAEYTKANTHMQQIILNALNALGASL